MVVCRYFLKGTCWYGDDCRYEHIRDNANDNYSETPVSNKYSALQYAETRKYPSWDNAHVRYRGNFEESSKETNRYIWTSPLVERRKSEDRSQVSFSFNKALMQVNRTSFPNNYDTRRFSNQYEAQEPQSQVPFSFNKAFQSTKTHIPHYDSNKFSNQYENQGPQTQVSFSFNKALQNANIHSSYDKNVSRQYEVHNANGQMQELSRKENTQSLTPDTMEVVETLQQGRNRTGFSEVPSMFQTNSGVVIPSPSISSMPTGDVPLKSKQSSSSVSRIAGEDKSSVYTPITELTDKEREQFEAQRFVLGKIPTRPPAKSFC